MFGAQNTANFFHYLQKHGSAYIKTLQKKTLVSRLGLIDTKQLQNEVLQEALVDNTNQSLNNFWYPTRTKFNNCVIYL